VILRWLRRADASASGALCGTPGGRTLATYEIVIMDTAGRRVCTSRLTCLIRDQVPGQEANGDDPLRERGSNRQLNSPGTEEDSLCTARRRVANVVRAGPGGSSR